jgi:hypothetical protein
MTAYLSKQSQSSHCRSCAMGEGAELPYADGCTELSRASQPQTWSLMVRGHSVSRASRDAAGIIR